MPVSVLGDRDICANRAPQRLTGLGVERKHLTVEGLVEDLAFGILHAAGLVTAAGDLDGAVELGNVGTEFPDDPAVLRKVKAPARCWRRSDRPG